VPQAFGLGLIFGVVNGFIKPVVKALALPIRLLTLGLIGIVINIVAFIGVAWLAGQVGIDFTVGGFPADDFSFDTIVGAAIGGIVMGVISAAIGLVVRD
jgi:putative membrane protein